eukprot:4174601-Amphidinium_carterae.1
MSAASNASVQSTGVAPLRRMLREVWRVLPQSSKVPPRGWIGFVPPAFRSSGWSTPGYAGVNAVRGLMDGSPLVRLHSPHPAPIGLAGQPHSDTSPIPLATSHD